LGSRDSGRSEGTAALDGVLHIMGDCVGRMGRSSKHRSEAYQAEFVTADPIDLIFESSLLRGVSFQPQSESGQLAIRMIAQRRLLELP